MLKGIKVLDLSRLLPGPFCSMLLSDLGCEVLKVEEPDRGDYVRELYPSLFETVNRNKKSLTLNLKDEEARKIFYELCKETDVIIESFRPGVTGRLKIDYSTIREINPKIVYCSLSGYGQDGPYKDLPGHDINYLGVAGVLAISGDPQGPPSETTIFPIADLSNSLFAAISIISALFSVRVNNNEGEYIDISIIDSVTALMGPSTAEYIGTGRPSKEKLMKRSGYEVFKTKNDKFISLACLEDKFFLKLCDALGLEAIAHDPRFSSLEGRNQSYKQINEQIAKVLIDHDFEYWFEHLARFDIPCAPVYRSLDEIFEDRHLQFRGIFEFIEGTKSQIPQFLFHAKFSGTAIKTKSPAPSLGQHTEEILLGLGYPDGEIGKFREEKII